MSYIFFFETRARVSPGLDLDWPWTKLALIYEGQGQGRQNQVRAGLDRPVDSLILTETRWRRFFLGVQEAFLVDRKMVSSDSYVTRDLCDLSSKSIGLWPVTDELI